MIHLAGHRAPHACDPHHMNRTTFWACSPQHAMASFGMDGQDGTKVGNRFMVFRRNKVNGANGVLLWGPVKHTLEQRPGLGVSKRRQQSCFEMCFAPSPSGVSPRGCRVQNTSRIRKEKV